MEQEIIGTDIIGSVDESFYCVNFESITAKTKVGQTETCECILSEDAGDKFVIRAGNVYI